MRILLTIGAVFVIMQAATFAVYTVLALLTGLEPPSDGSPAQMLVGLSIVKLGIAGGFVALFFVARDVWLRRTFAYALIWWATFAVIEVGQAIAPGYSWLDALGGIVAEAVYFPLSALATRRLLRTGIPAHAPV